MSPDADSRPEKTMKHVFLLAGLATSCLATMPALSATADRIWSGGTILTINDEAPRAAAVAEKNGRIVAVGSEAEVMALRGPATRVIDLEGRTLLPGFVDAHGHMMMGGLQALSANLLAPPDGSVTDIASLQAVLREWAAAKETAVRQSKLIVGFGYDNATLAEKRHPTRDDLDAVSRDIPIVLVHQSGHIIAVNSRALEVAGISADTPDPQGGVIRRRPDSSEPDGVLEELAAFPVLIKLLAPIGPEGFKAFARGGAALWARFGYTTADEGRSVPGTARLLGQVADQEGYSIDVVTYPDVLADKAYIEQNVSLEYRNRFRVGGAKLTIDGSPQGFTAWRDRPYYDPVGNYPKGYAGYAAATPEQVLDAVDWAYDKNIQLLVHSNGERASDLLIAAHTIAQMKYPGDARERRHVLIHGQFLREDQVDAFGRLGILPSLFPMHTFYWGDWHTEHTVGPELAPNISPTGWFRERGLIFTTHHDAPVAFPDSMRVLSATVTRVARGSGRVIGPQQRVDVPTALKAMTIWPAWQHFEENDKGSLEVGKLADFVILSADPTVVEPGQLAQIKVVETIKEGTTVFRLDETDAAAALGSRPGSGLGGLLGLGASYLEFKALPADEQTDEKLALIRARGHDGHDCPSDVLMVLAAAMAGDAAGMAH
jgi:predicted amidohydrolase YtcJ